MERQRNYNRGGELESWDKSKESNHLIDIDTEGGYTWCNNQMGTIEERQG